MEIKVQLVDGNTGTLSGGRWIEKNQLLIISGMPWTLGQDDLLSNAEHALTDAGFTYGSAHPDIPGLYLYGDIALEVTAGRTPAEGGNAVATLSYSRTNIVLGQFEQWAIRGSTVLVQEATNTDKTGAEIFSEWKKDAGATAIKQPGTVDIYLPTQSLSFSKGGYDSPVAHSKSLVGRTNSDTFQGDPAGHWLCMGCDYDSSDGGSLWDRSWQFARHPDKWKQTIYYIAEDGRPPANYNASYNSDKAVKLIEVYGSAAFGVLSLPTAS